MSFRFDEARQCFVVGPTNTPCKGLHSFLEETLYPTYQSTCGSATRKKTTTTKNKKMKSRQKGKPRTYGMKLALLRGKRVDDQLKAWTEGKKTKRRDLLTKQIIDACDSWGWTPLESQVAVGIESARTATAFDLLCQNTKRELILIEVKTGFEGYWKTSKGQKLEHPAVAHVPSNPKTHAVLQAAVTSIYTEATRGVAIDHVYVLRSYSEGCERIVVRTTDQQNKKKAPRWLPAAMKVVGEALIARQK